MIGLDVSLLAILAATLFPAYLGLFTPSLFRRPSQARRITAFAFGVFLWYFSGTIGESSYLGVNRGFPGDLGQAALLLVFIAGLSSFFLADRQGFLQRGEENGGKASHLILVPGLVAAALSVHGLAEGMAFGALASSTSSTSPLEALGGYGPAISYVLHKTLEASMIAALYLSYRSSNQAGNPKLLIRDLAILGMVFAAPSLIGSSVGYYVPLDTTYFFALATGASIYVALKLASSLLAPVISSASPHSEQFKLTLLIISGFVSIYLAALFHSTSLGV